MSAQFIPVIRQGLEYVGHHGRIAATRCLATLAELLQQFVALMTDQRKGDAALFDLAKARRGRASDLTLELDELFQDLEAGLAQEDGALATWRTFDGFLGRDATGRHPDLDGGNIEGAQGQVVDVRALEGDHIGDQSVGVVQPLVQARVDVGLAVLTEGFEGFLDESISLGIRQPAQSLGVPDRFQGARG